MLATSRLIAREKWPVKMLLTVYQLSVPLEVDIGIAGNWADA